RSETPGLPDAERGGTERAPELRALSAHGSLSRWVLALRERLRLDRVELRLRDRAGGEERVRALDLRRRSAARGDRLYVGVELALRRLRLVHVSFGHVLALRDQVDEDAEERQQDH